MKAIRYFRPDVLFAIGPWHRAVECDGELVAACGYKPPEGWIAEVEERGPWCSDCMEMANDE